MRDPLARYLGPRTIYVLEVESGSTLRDETHDHLASRAVGERARLQVDAHQTRVVT